MKIIQHHLYSVEVIQQHDDAILIPNFKNVGLGLNSSIDKMGASFDPSNFLKTKSYGQAPTG